MEDILAIVFIFGSPVIMMGIYSWHKQRMTVIEKMQARVESVSESAIAMLRDEIAQLRETTTKYDMTVDHTLAEIKRRLDIVESRSGSSYVAAAPLPASQQQEEPPATLQAGR